MKKFSVVGTWEARSDINEIQYYLQDKIPLTVNYVIDKIIERTKQQETCPLSGAIEESLKELNQGHRYLIIRNYKIIYRPQRNKVFITSIFSTYQHPDKLLFGET